MQKGRNLQQRIREQNQKWQDQEESDGCVDECDVERTIPGRDVIHNEYHIGVYQQEGKDAKEDGRRQECFKYLALLQRRCNWT
jgi:hypothetical protein